MPVRHVTLTPDEVETVSMPRAYDTVAAFSWDPAITDDVWTTVNGEDPVPQGDDNRVVPAGSRREISGETTVSAVKLLCAGAAKVEIEFS